MFGGTVPLDLYVTIAVGLLVIAGTIRSVRRHSPPSPLSLVLLTAGIVWLSGGIRLGLPSPGDVFKALDIGSAPRPYLATVGMTGVFWLGVFHWLRPQHLSTWLARTTCLGTIVLVEPLYSSVSNHVVLRTFGLDINGGLLPSTETVAYFFSRNLSMAGAVESAFLVWLVYFWGKGRDGLSGTNETVRAVGLTGGVMANVTNQSTRLLCASALLGHGGARDTIMAWLKDQNRAVALELGLDLRLAAQVARFADDRGKRFWWTYFGIFCASTALSFVLPGAGIAGVLAAAIVWGRRTIEDRNTLAPLFWPGRFQPGEIAGRFPAELTGEELASLPAEDQNLFVYGGFSPFVGAGHDLGGWSVAIALDKAREHFGSASAIRSFAIPELYDAIDAGLDGLQVRGIEKKDCFFVRGTDIRGEPAMLPDVYGRPVQSIEPEVAERYMFKDDEKVRHYRCYRIVDWGGELALSYFLRCSRRGNTLFVETKRHLLTPLAASLRSVDSLVPMDLKERLMTYAGGLIAGPIMTFVSPLWAVFEIQRGLSAAFSSEVLDRRKQIENSPLFNYGTVRSLREALSSGEYGHYFQKIDGDFYNKLFEREVLDTLIEFLNDHGIDTSDLKERQTTILNSGVIVQGGDVKAESLAVGAGSRAVKQVKKALGAKVMSKGAGE